MLEWIQTRIKGQKPNKGLDKAKKDAVYQKNLYRGENLDDIITDYRKGESETQKNQRKRITVGRTKHLLRQIGNVFNYLQMMDANLSSIITVNEKNKELLEKWIYDNNINDLAFNSVKMYGALVDANAWMCASSENDEIVFNVIPSEYLFDINSVNGKIKGVLFQIPVMVGNDKRYRYLYYHEKGIIELTPVNVEGFEKWENFYIKTTESDLMLAFCLGYIPDDISSLPTKVTTTEAASELFKALIQLGSDADTVKAAHGIIQKFAYARRCNFSNTNGGNRTVCVNGVLWVNNEQTDVLCPKCKGSGLDIHTSSQDIITVPIPDDPNQMRPLSDLVHTVTVPDSILNYGRLDIGELRKEIMETVFNSSVVTKDDIAATATEKVIDLQGVYATLNILGKHVSNLFIWMVECKMWHEGIKDVEVIHGYNLTLKLESVETLSQKRKTLIDANAPIEVIKALDLAILQKQHLDSPAYVNRFIEWEKYRPFSDKSPDEINTILAWLPNGNYFKVLYNFWGHIKRQINEKYGDAFYDDPKKEEKIKEEVKILQELLKQDEPKLDLNFD